MTHILQFAIDIDDEGIKKSINSSAEQQIMQKLYDDCRKAFISKHSKEKSWSWREETQEAKFLGCLDEMATKAVQDIIDENKDVIISRAAEILADRISRTKKCRELKNAQEEQE